MTIAPAWLDEPLRSWIRRFFVEVPASAAEEIAEQLAVELRLSLQPRQVASAAHGVTVALGRDDQLRLDVVDWSLELPPRRPIRALDNAPAHLERLLLGAGSGWRVSSDGTRLEERVDPTVVAATDEAIAAATRSAPSAAEHLRTAWVAMYGRSPNYREAVDEAIRAIEAAAEPVVTGQDFGTLAGIFRELEKGGRWELPRPLEWGANRDTTDAGPILAGMVTIVWHGQGHRHGSPTSAEPRSAEQAQTIVTTAVALIHLFSAGLIRPAKPAS